MRDGKDTCARVGSRLLDVAEEPDSPVESTWGMGLQGRPIRELLLGFVAHQLRDYPATC